MKKRLFPVVIGIVGAMFMASCSSNDTPPRAENSANTEIYELMQNNYLWKLPTNVDKTLDPTQFFNTLLSSEDKYTVRGETFHYSWITPANSGSVSYDSGLEYAANRYENGEMFYVIYYVKPDTNAHQAGLKRGYLIGQVNGTPVTSENKNTLLRNALQTGGEVKLLVVNPAVSNPVEFKITGQKNYQENPIFTSKVIEQGSSKVGYLVYNQFNSGSNGAYDNQLMNVLQDFTTKGIDNLVLDLRYNIGGGYSSAQYLGSAIVKNRNTASTFIYFVGSTKLLPYNFVDETANEVTIPKLGDKLKKVYIITGQNTASMPESFINALKPYLGSDLVLVGEKTQGRNIATVQAKTPNNLWLLNMAIGRYADKDQKSDYASGFTPNYAKTDVDQKVVTILGELGDPKEAILAEVLSLINGGAGTRSFEVSNGTSVKWSSLQEKSNIPSMNLDDLN
jgi:carboxyl-terminal processing protease